MEQGSAACFTGSVGTRSARERARDELTREILDVARRHLARDGAAGLSLRAVARDLGLSSSAVYRYVTSRDDLLTRLIMGAYDASGEVVESADAASRRAGEPSGQRWLTVARALRTWALAHPHEWALVYGSPVPGYAAPPATVPAAQRLVRVLVGVVAHAHAAGELALPPRVLPVAASDEARAIREDLPPDRPDLVERTMVLWSGLVGAVSFELFGHLVGGVRDPALFFDVASAAQAEVVGLKISLE